jgi:hypothetical protein
MTLDQDARRRQRGFRSDANQRREFQIRPAH